MTGSGGDEKPMKGVKTGNIYPQKSFFCDFFVCVEEKGEEGAEEERK